MLKNYNAPTITISNACLRYHQQLIFSDLHCTLAAGQTTCLLGPSGVGKSSLLRLIAGLDNQATEQSADITTSDQQPLSHRIAYLAQTDLLLPWLSSLDNVLLGLSLRGNQPHSPPHRARAEELLAQVGLHAAMHKRTAQLSGGMRQRVALARTLMEDRPVVLMDEPFSSLDTVTRLKLQELAAQLLADRTVLLVTHDPLEALRLGHQIMVMEGHPAHLVSHSQPSGKTPRSVTDPQLLVWQGELLQHLMNIPGAPA